MTHEDFLAAARERRDKIHAQRSYCDARMNDLARSATESLRADCGQYLLSTPHTPIQAAELREIVSSAMGAVSS